MYFVNKLTGDPVSRLPMFSVILSFVVLTHDSSLIDPELFNNSQNNRV